MAVELGGVDHVGQSSLGLSPLAGLQSAIRINPELLRLEVDQHLTDTVLDLLLRWDTWGVDVIDTGTDVAGVGFVDEDLEELGIRLAVLNGENIGIESSNGMEEVLELRVAEVGVDLGRVLDTGNGEAERLDSPIEVCLTLLTSSEGKTLTESGLINLNDEDTGSLKVNNLITESKSKLLSLDRLVDIITGE